MCAWTELRWGVSERNFRDGWELMDTAGADTGVHRRSGPAPRELEEHFPEFKFPMFSGKMGADVVEQEASKAEGLMRICQHYGHQHGAARLHLETA
ncbi:MAG: hypothetical protein ACLTBV_18855 [Enterocloster bolteae]